MEVQAIHLFVAYVTVAIFCGIQRSNSLPMKSVSTSSTKNEPNRAQTDKDFLNNVLSHPRIRFYEQGNGTDTYVDYDLIKEKTDGGCLDLELVDPWLPLNLKDISVDTFGTCVRLFEAPSCIGWSLAIYPGSSGSRKDFMPSKQKVVNSLGPCLGKEFQKAKVMKNYDGTRRIIKDVSPSAFVPDEIRVSGYEKIVSFSTVTTRGKSSLKSSSNVRRGNLKQAKNKSAKAIATKRGNR